MTAVLKLTVDDYLSTEADAPHKREFVGGEIIAMAGAEPEHNAVRERLSVEVSLALRGRPCQSFSADQRVRITETGLYCYPDLVIVCGSPEFVPPRPRSLTNPTALFEVLSPSTESWDRGAKFAHVQQCSTLRAYVLIAPETRRIEWYTRQEAGRWVYQSIERKGALRLESIDVTLDVAAIFAQLELLGAE